METLKQTKRNTAQVGTLSIYDYQDIKHFGACGNRRKHLHELLTIIKVPPFGESYLDYKNYSDVIKNGIT